MPTNALDSLNRVAAASAKVIRVSSETDEKPMLPQGFTYAVNDKGFGRFGARDVLSSVRTALEEADQPNFELREQMVENELRIFIGEINPAVAKVLRLNGPSIITLEATRYIDLAIGEEFGSLLGGG